MLHEWQMAVGKSSQSKSNVKAEINTKNTFISCKTIIPLDLNLKLEMINLHFLDECIVITVIIEPVPLGSPSSTVNLQFN